MRKTPQYNYPTSSIQVSCKTQTGQSWPVRDPGHYFVFQVNFLYNFCEQNLDTSAGQVEVLLLNHSYQDATTDSRCLHGPLVPTAGGFLPCWCQRSGMSLIWRGNILGWNVLRSVFSGVWIIDERSGYCCYSCLLWAYKSRHVMGGHHCHLS